MAGVKGKGGKKGRSGRWSAYKELGAARFLADVYFNTHSQEEIEDAIRSGKFSIAQRHVLNAMEGDQKAIEGFTRKLFPDVQEISGPEGQPINLTHSLGSAINKTYGSGGKAS